MTGWTTWADGRALAAAAGLTLWLAQPAAAVDLPPAPDLPSAAAASEDFSGWYLRGDIGAGFESAPDLAGGAPVAAAVAPLLPSVAAVSFGKPSLSPSGVVGGGLGYVLNSWLRTDATLEYRFGGRLEANYAIADPAPLAVGRLRGSAASLVALLNGYVDLGTWWGATPFVGAGVGVAENTLSGVSDPGLALARTGAVAPTGGFFTNGSRASFAWALTAGFDFDLAPNLKLELSYRFLDLGRIAPGGPRCFPGGGACAGIATSSRGSLVSNDVRIGLVYLIGEPSSPAGPVVTRH